MADLLPATNELNVMNQLGSRLVASGFLPNSIKRPEQALAIMLMGRELEIPAMQAFSKIHVIQGKPTMSPELMLALIYRKYPKAQILFIEQTAKRCVIKAKRPDEPELQTFIFTIEEAAAMQLTSKDNWKKQPGTMLQWRCVSKMARAKFPEVLCGISYTPEELGAQLDDDGEGAIKVDATGNPIVDQISEFDHVPLVEDQPEIVESEVEEIAPPEPDQGFKKPLSEKQLKRLFAIAHAARFSNDQLKAYMKKEFGKESTKELSYFEYEKLCIELEKVSKAVEDLTAEVES